MKYTVASLTVVALLSGNAMAQRKPNIILFLVDDMGWQDTSLPFWKDTTDLNRIYETPNMERLAERGVMFTHAYACSISSPSRVSLFTGANAAQHKVTNWTLKKDTPTDRKDAVLEFEAWNYNGLCPEAGLEHSFYAKCLPQLLRENGYATMMVGKAHFGSMGTPAANPLTIGFDYNIAGHAAGAMGSYLGEEGYGAKSDPERAAVWAVPDLEQYHGTDTFLTEALTLEAKSLLDKVTGQSKPFFLYMSHYAVHAPFGTDRRFYQKYADKGLSHKEAQYAALLEGMDKSLGDLMDYVDEKGIADNTVIIFMSDNGGYTIGRHDKNYPLSEGKGSLKEGGIREPMIVCYPHVAKPSTINDTPVIIEDFFPTLLEIAGVCDYRTPQHIDGISFLKQIKGHAGDKERALFFHRFTALVKLGDQLLRKILFCLYTLVQRHLQIFHLIGLVILGQNTQRPRLHPQVHIFRHQNDLFPFSLLCYIFGNGQYPMIGYIFAKRVIHLGGERDTRLDKQTPPSLT